MAWSAWRERVETWALSGIYQCLPTAGWQASDCAGEFLACDCPDWVDSIALEQINVSRLRALVDSEQPRIGPCGFGIKRQDAKLGARRERVRNNGLVNNACNLAALYANGKADAIYGNAPPELQRSGADDYESEW